MPEVCCCQGFPACLRNLKSLSFPGTDSKCILLQYKHKIREAAAGQKGRVVLRDGRHCQHRDNLEIWHNHVLERNSDFRNCSEVALMVCGVLKALSGGGSSDYKIRKKQTHREKFHNGEQHLKEKEK